MIQKKEGMIRLTPRCYGILAERRRSAFGGLQNLPGFEERTIREDIVVFNPTSFDGYSPAFQIGRLAEPEVKPTQIRGGT